MKKNVIKALRTASPLPTQKGPVFPRTEDAPPNAKDEMGVMHAIGPRTARGPYHQS